MHRTRVKVTANIALNRKIEPRRLAKKPDDVPKERTDDSTDVIKPAEIVISKPEHESKRIDSSKKEVILTAVTKLTKPRVRPQIRITPRLNRNSFSHVEEESREETTQSINEEERENGQIEMDVNGSNDDNVHESVNNENVGEGDENRVRPHKKRNTLSEITKKMAAAKKEFAVKFNGGALDRQRLTMRDLIFYNPVGNPMPVEEKKPIRQNCEKNAEVKATDEAEIDDECDDETPAPQVKIGLDGEIVLDEQSLVIKMTANTKTKLDTAINYDDIDTGYGVYNRSPRPKMWTERDTRRFFRVLHTVGTDFSAMLKYFPERTRQNLKKKFKREEKKNGSAIDQILRNPANYDLQHLDVMLERDDALKTEKKTCQERARELKEKVAKKRKRRDDERQRGIRRQRGTGYTYREAFLDTDDESDESIVIQRRYVPEQSESGDRSPEYITGDLNNPRSPKSPMKILKTEVLSQPIDQLARGLERNSESDPLSSHVDGENSQNYNPDVSDVSPSIPDQDTHCFDVSVVDGVSYVQDSTCENGKTGSDVESTENAKDQVVIILDQQQSATQGICSTLNSYLGESDDVVVELPVVNTIL